MALTHFYWKDLLYWNPDTLDRKVKVIEIIRSVASFCDLKNQNEII